MQASVGEFVFPGDLLTPTNQHKGVVLYGPGLRPHEEDPDCLAVTKPGKLACRSPNIYWIEGRGARYIPRKGDLVVGVVIKKAGDLFKVDIGSSEFASLSSFAFEGATKKQKPDLQIGDLVYAKLLSAHKEMEPELVCVDSYYKAGKLGPLPNNGFLMNLSLDFVYRLLDIRHPLLRTLGRKFVYEIAIGVNGKVWINSKSRKETFRIMEILLAAEKINERDVAEQCRKV